MELSRLHQILIFLIFFAGYAYLIPAFENPDETIHYTKIFEADKLELKLEGDGNLYYYIFNKISVLFGVTEDYQMLKYNSDFDYFSNEFRYKHGDISINHGVFFFRTLNLVFILPVLLIFLKEKINKKIFPIALLLPGVMWFFSCINPDVLSILMSFLIFNYLFKKKILTYLLLVLAYFFMDRTVILMLLSILLAEIYSSIATSAKIYRVLFFVILGYVLIHSYIIAQSLLIVGEEILYEPFKSIIAVIVSFYGLVGSMSIRATFIEYGLLFLMLFWGLYRILKSKNLFHNPVFYKSLNILTFFIILWFYILSFAPSLDQGRYFYLILPFILFIVINIYDLLYFSKSKLIMFSFITNSLMYLAIITVYIKG